MASVVSLKGNTEETGMAQTLPHQCGLKQCRGQLKRINNEPVMAGKDFGIGYYLYQCDDCGDMVAVGGSKFS